MKKQNQKARPKSRVPKPMPDRPPPYQPTVTVGMVRRFQCTTDTTVATVTRAQLLNLMVMNVAGTTVNYRLLDAVLVRKIKIWGSADTGGSNTGSTVAIQWLSAGSPSRIVSDNNVGSTFGAKLSTKPPDKSYAALWSLTGTNESEQLFTLATSVGDIVDVHLTCVFQNEGLVATGAEAPTSVASTASGTTGTVYYLSLDVNTTAKLPPVTCKTIV